MKKVTAAVLVIGNEILSGRTQDANLHYLAQSLMKHNIRLMEARVIPDVEEEIVEAINHLRQRYDYVFTTGGIGPTHDDITAASIAKAFNRPLIRDPRAMHLLERHYGDQLTETRSRMAQMPEGSNLISNPVSTAPGFQVENVFVLAGVPSICRAMFDGLAPHLQGGDPIHSETISAFVAESVIADDLTALAGRYETLDIGSYPYFRNGKFGTALVVRGTDAKLLRQAAQELRDLIKKTGADFAEDQQVLW